MFVRLVKILHAQKEKHRPKTKKQFIKVHISIQKDKPETMMTQGPGINHE
jgi:hypothetical protein